VINRVRITELKARKSRGEKIAMLTAYDATMAGLLERAGVDMLLVGDSVGMTVLGYDSTLPVTLEMMIHHTAAVIRGTRRALVVADMPFLTYQTGDEDALRNAGRLLQEGGAAAVKLEGGRSVVHVVRRLVETGIPVMGHLGLLPQSVHQMGGYGKRGTNPDEIENLQADAQALQDAGAFAVVLEMIPSDLAGRITSGLEIPTIGIGAGPDCDGQILVSHDMLGLFDRFVPSFVKPYADLAGIISAAAKAYVDDVQKCRFPHTAASASTARSV
jgi:3-methyl-2-oxobutanoate hydroxymethyltransferase